MQTPTLIRVVVSLTQSGQVKFAPAFLSSSRMTAIVSDDNLPVQCHKIKTRYVLLSADSRHEPELYYLRLRAALLNSGLD